MKIKLSQAQWEAMGKKAGWMDFEEVEKTMPKLIRDIPMKKTEESGVKTEVLKEEVDNAIERLFKVKMSLKNPNIENEADEIKTHLHMVKDALERIIARW